MSINSTTVSVLKAAFEYAENQVDSFHFYVILPHSSHNYKNRDELINKNNNLHEVFKSILKKVSNAYESQYDNTVKVECLNEQERKAFELCMYDYMDKIKRNSERLKFFEAEKDVLDSYLKHMSDVQKALLSVESKLFSH